MRKEHVIWLIHRILGQHQDVTQTITLRNDNGSQFIAHAVREYLQDRGVSQEFIHVATQEENCFIESYHSILQREVMDSWQFESIQQAQEVMKRWQRFYNERRRHNSLQGSRPARVWQQYGNQQLGKVQEPKEDIKLYPWNGERKSLKIGESRSVDKLVREQMSTTFEDQRATSAQTVPENPSS